MQRESSEKTVIKEVTFYPIKPTEKGLIGFASCLFNDRLSLNSIAVYSTSSGDIRLVFPDKILPNAKKIHLFYPVDNDTYEEIKQAIYRKIEDVNEKVRKSNDKETNGIF